MEEKPMGLPAREQEAVTQSELHAELQRRNQELEEALGARTLELAQCQRALHELRARGIGELVEFAPEALVIVDSKGRIATMNRGAQALFGYTSDEVEGKLVEVLMPDSFAECHAEMRKEYMHEPRIRPMGSTLAMLGKRADGSDFPVEIMLSPVILPEGTHIIAGVRDATVHRALQEEVQRTNKKLLQAQKMEAVGSLAGGVAHDFNNLLTSIICFAGFVRDDLPSGDRRREDIAQVLSAADRAVGLTRQLLAFSRQQPAEVHRIDLCSTLSGLRRLLHITVGERIELSVSADDVNAIVLADETQLDQVILNLAINARDAMPSGGTLSIRATVVDVDATARDFDLEPGRYVRMQVADSGTGMDEATIAQIFDPFFTTKGPTKGTGLGLATCHGIVGQLGGQIGVESELGKGTTFTVYLPQHSAPTTGLSNAYVAPSSMRGDETILVVEDEQAVRLVAERALRAQGYKVILANDAVEAMELFHAHKDAIDLVFSDIVMPRGSGFELAADIKHQRPDVCVLLTSGYSDQRAVRESSEFPIVWKPYAPASLARQIRLCLDEARVVTGHPVDSLAPKRLLVVDDDARLREAMCRLLKGHGYEVEGFDLAGDAKQRLLATPNNFDGIICDFNIAGESGLDLITWAEESVPALTGKSLLVTGNAMHENVVDFANANPTRIMQKPFNVPAFLSRVAVLVGAAI